MDVEATDAKGDFRTPSNRWVSGAPGVGVRGLGRGGKEGVPGPPVTPRPVVSPRTPHSGGAGPRQEPPDRLRDLRWAKQVKRPFLWFRVSPLRYTGSGENVLARPSPLWVDVPSPTGPSPRTTATCRTRSSCWNSGFRGRTGPTSPEEGREGPLFGATRSRHPFPPPP